MPIRAEADRCSSRASSVQQSLRQVRADYKEMQKHTRGQMANCNVLTSGRHVPFREALWAASQHANHEEFAALLHDRLFSKQNLKVVSSPNLRCAVQGTQHMWCL